MTILNPRFWIMNNPFSREWDTKLNELLDNHKFEKIDNCYAKLGGITMWIENYPYAAFTPVAPMRLSVRPSRKTVVKAYGRLVGDLLGK